MQQLCYSCLAHVCSKARCLPLTVNIPLSQHSLNDCLHSQVFCIDLAAKSWHSLKLASAAAPSPDAPCARGWFAAAAVGSKLVVSGGLDVNNSRLDDVWVLEH